MEDPATPSTPQRQLWDAATLLALIDGVLAGVTSVYLAAATVQRTHADPGRQLRKGRGFPAKGLQSG